MSASSPSLAAILFANQPLLKPDPTQQVEIFVRCLREAQLLGHISHVSHRVLSKLPSTRVIEITFQSDNHLNAITKPDFVKHVESYCDSQILIRPLRPGKPPALSLAVFDMDSTLIQQEVIELIAAKAGVEPAVADITSRAMNGELDFSASLRERVALLRGISDSIFEELKPKLTLVPGAVRLLKCLKASGVKTAVLSGGFTPLAKYIAERLAIDYVHANELEIESSVLTGKLVPECVIVNAERKRELLKKISEDEGILNSSETLAVGDGANDLLMLAEAGLGIAVNAKPKVQLLAPTKLNCKSIDDVLYVLGFTEQEIEAIIG